MKLTVTEKLKTLLLCIFIFASTLRAQWQTYGPYGGSFHGLQEHNGRLFVGTNNGAHSLMSNDSLWHPSNGSIERKPVNIFAVHNNILFAGLDGYGVYSSTNNGISWTPSVSGLTSHYLMSLFSSDSGLFVGTADGVFYSSNNGMQWTLANGGIPSNYYIYCMEQMGDTIFGGSYGLGLYLTKDNGTTWNSVGGGFPPNTFVYALHKEGNSLYAGTSAGVYKSIDRGLNWFSSNSGFPWGMWAKCFGDKPGYLFAGTYSEGILVSNDSGATWSFSNNGIPDLPIQSGLPHNYPSIEAIHVFNNKIFASTVFGIYVSSDNGNSWSDLNGDILSTNISSLAANSSCVVAGEVQTGIYRSTYGNNYWQRTNSGLTSVSVLDMAQMGEVIFSAVQNERVFVSLDNGMTWNWAGNGLNTDAMFLTADSVRALAITTGGQFIAGGLFQTLDTGNTWVQIPTGFGGKSCAAISTNGIYVGCYQGKVYYTNDSGLNWQDLSYNLPSEKVNKVLAFGNNLFAATDGAGLFKLSQNTSSWVYLNNGLTNDTVKDLIFHNNALYAATWAGGVFFSTDSGNTWNSMNNGLSNQHVRKLVFGANHLFAGTDAGVYQFDLTLQINNKKINPESLKIYPNPSNKVFHIELINHWCPSHEIAIITVYNVKGEELLSQKIVLEKDILFDFGNDLSPGKYLISIQIQNQVYSGKLLIE